MSDKEWDHDRFTLESMRVGEIWATYPLDRKSWPELSALVDRFPTKYKISALALLRSAYDANALERLRMNITHLEREFQMAQERERLAREWKREARAFWTGVGFLAFALVASGTAGNKDSSTSLILRVMAGLGVGLIIAFLPGLFSLDSKIQTGTSKVVIRATGGFAAFAVIYFFDPGSFSGIFG
jgi:hypothetical protein